jgi:hypothetical protein
MQVFRDIPADAPLVVVEEILEGRHAAAPAMTR